VSSTHAARLRVRRADLAEPVLERLVMALAARVDLPVDRIADAQIVTEALMARAPRNSANGALTIDLAAGPGGVDLSVGPLPTGGAARVVAESEVPGVGVVLDRLVDHWDAAALDAETEVLRLTIGPGAPPSR
jgi:hypothetical protein